MAYKSIQNIIFHNDVISNCIKYHLNELKPINFMQNTEEKSLKTLHLAFCAGTTFFILIVHFVLRPLNFDQLNQEIDVTSWVIIILGTLLAITPSLIFKNRLNDVKDESQALDKKSYMIKWGILEGGTLISFVFYATMNTHQLVQITGFMLWLLLLLAKPKIQNI